MSEKEPKYARRRFIGTGAAALAAFPVAVMLGVSSRAARAANLPHLQESDPQAKALQYSDDAAKSKRTSSDQFCHNCLNFEGKAGDAWGPCKIFPGKDVNHNGWCAAWVKKPG